MASECSYLKKSEIYPLDQLDSAVAEIMAVADAMAAEVGDEVVDVETDSRSTNAHTTKWTIIPPKRSERLTPLKAIQSPPGPTCKPVTTAVSYDTSRLTEPTSNVP